MTLKLKGDLDVLKMYPHSESEAASLRHSKRRAWVKKSTKICLKVKGQSQDVKAPNYFQRYLNRYSDQATATFDR